MQFSKKDIKQIEQKGLTLKKVEEQLELFKKGIPHVNIKKAATVGDGILEVSENVKNHYIELFEQNRSHLSLEKFVPASGAATRMFKFLFKFLDDYNPKKDSINSYINKNKATDMSLFQIGHEKLPFYDFVRNKAIEINPNFEKQTLDSKYVSFIKTMLEKEHLNLGNYPKGLLPFHKYKGHNATAFEEHLFEAALYVASNKKANLHFTISGKHKHKFDEEFTRIEEIVERKTDTAFNIVFSYQKESTDTIAVTTDNNPFREPDGSLLFRPSGHGALIENLNDIQSDIIFIKNIDNVVVYKYEQEVSQYKKLLAGLLIEVQNKAFQYSKILNEKTTLEETLLIEIAEFLSNKLNVVISDEFEKYAPKYQMQYLKDKLDRPIRICGMVKNEGEPGGGPFWVKDESGNISLQIVESAQIDKKNKSQKMTLKNATHFNPVDLVCGVKNYKGEKYDLTKFVDPKTAFITMKTKTGKDIKALELPGLWNGSMANWNTIFVEVPLITFNPVKTVNDLLKPAHQTS